MKKYLAIYHMPADADKWMAEASKEDQEAGMKKWMDWKAAHEDMILDFGAPLSQRSIIGKGPAHPLIAGYSLLQAESLEELEAQCQDHPHIGWHPEAYIEFYELALM